MSSRPKDVAGRVRHRSSPEEEVYLSIIRTAEALSWGISETLKGADLTPAQYNVLRILRGAAPGGATCGQISERMVTKDSDITRLLERLDTRGLIRRERDGQDRRYVTVRITDEGLALLSSLDEPIAQCHRKQLGHMGRERLTSLGGLLDEARGAGR